MCLLELGRMVEILDTPLKSTKKPKYFEVLFRTGKVPPAVLDSEVLKKLLDQAPAPEMSALPVPPGVPRALTDRPAPALANGEALDDDDEELLLAVAGTISDDEGVGGEQLELVPVPVDVLEDSGAAPLVLEPIVDDAVEPPPVPHPPPVVDPYDITHIKGATDQAG